ncbi:MAG: 2-oxoacid:acceptor oxidoreductase family protein [Saccharolobus sp.]|uniref:2-oxoacid:acceptor oxidoreductase family protein n=1 Tax=Saccharolobus TaxID=2100760 RepID=UPI001F0F493F|nr:2-oxoacid:acceptor oxidoreductase family protein [Saccharolobus shibatae]MCH4816364.1 2-oxoacid:acceptor oxidoreductase family protein [Saccharolobus shibatae]
MTLIELALRGRGGQGIVTAGELVTKAMVLEDKYAQSIPFFGGERRGAPVVSFLRLSDKPILLHREVYNPDGVAIFDTSLIQIINVTEGLKENGFLLLNTNTPKRIWKNEYIVDATSIAKELGLVVAGWAVVNTAMIGALVKILGQPSLHSLEEAVKEEFPGKIGELNAEAVEMGYKEVKRVD